ncbi:PAS domain S-box protein [Mucilaginibacter daejeonensis]|uniref:PAS domain S-box protein n=1 Tax=Mucilaginibacter daejeonensis TaxID=398049 RepID=UPI001D170218|nr:PAS domain S-box protein [Mucilaginibacter daejeonensis]UEG52132.1 PAS domain S-box protein [Mucilaginibacter daejeonensis]
MLDLLNTLSDDANAFNADHQAVLNAVMTATDDAIITQDLNDNIMSWNPAAERLFGYTSLEALGQPISIIVPSERSAEQRYINGQISKGKKVDRFETICLTKPGTQKLISINVAPIYITERVIVGAAIVARDISERRSEDEKQATLTAIVSTSDDAIVSKTLQGIITSWNPAAEKLFGYTEQEVIGKHISLIIPQDRLQEENFIIDQVAQGRKVDQFETVRRTKDGRDIHLSITVSPVTDPSGRVIGASIIGKDLSATKQFREKQGMLAALISSSDDTIVSKTLDGKITSWNRAAERMFGYTAAEALGQHISLIIPTERLNEETFIIGQVSKGNKVDHFETVRVSKDGRSIPISLSVSPIIDENGQIIGASKIARDISEQVAMQEEKARLYDEIKALNDKKDEFIGLASHELKTPLTSIQAYLQILNGELSDERRKEFLRRATHQVKKLNSLVSDLLDISKIHAGELRFDPAPFDLHQLALDAIELISAANRQYSIDFNTDVKTIIVQGDPQRIEQVILNLLTNAIRYSNNNHQIDVYLSIDSDVAKVAVQDRGIGIPADKLEQIFSRFYRVGENKNVSGLGLGLYLSQYIIDRHGGRIWAESQPGEGSVFYFTLPIEKK